MFNYKDYIKYWYNNGFKGQRDSLREKKLWLEDACVLDNDRFDKYIHYDEFLRKDLSHYKTVICIFIGVFSRLKDNNKF